MIRFWQTDKDLLPVIQKGGCAALSSLYLLPDELSIPQVNAIIGNAITQELLGPDCTILSWARWIGSLASNETVIRYPLQFSRKTQSRDYQCAENEREILKWWLSNVKENHFTIGDGKGSDAWESMNRPDIMRAYATFVEKVIVEVV